MSVTQAHFEQEASPGSRRHFLHYFELATFPLAEIRLGIKPSQTYAWGNRKARIRAEFETLVGPGERQFEGDFHYFRSRFIANFSGVLSPISTALQVEFSTTSDGIGHVHHL
ncbi:hypothetical protein [Nocardia lijiangensis]|uniref:hypothetical protein n=1 Tax=Nocardia lijiangensis TaxID=299618 RepID=UPI000A704253|nr:hypothetical protein [Nocardia lijiangensis]